MTMALLFATIAALFQNHIWNNVPIVSNIGNNNMIAPLRTWVAVPVVLYVLAWENAEAESFRLHLECDQSC